MRNILFYGWNSKPNVFRFKLIKDVNIFHASKLDSIRLDRLKIPESNSAKIQY